MFLALALSMTATAVTPTRNLLRGHHLRTALAVGEISFLGWNDARGRSERAKCGLLLPVHTSAPFGHRFRHPPAEIPTLRHIVPSSPHNI